MTLNLSVAPAGTPAGDLSLFLFDDNAGEPGTRIGAFGTSDPAGDMPMDYSVTPTSALSLSANTDHRLRVLLPCPSPVGAGALPAIPWQADALPPSRARHAGDAVSAAPVGYASR